MRRYKADPDRVLELLKQGQSTTQVANSFEPPVSRQAIDEQRRRFIKQGLLPPSRARRGRKPKVIIPTKISPSPMKDGLGSLTLEHLDEIGVRMYEKAMKLPSVEEENWRLKNITAAQSEEIAILKKELAKSQDREQRIQLAKQQGIVHGD